MKDAECAMKNKFSYFYFLRYGRLFFSQFSSVQDDKKVWTESRLRHLYQCRVQKYEFIKKNKYYSEENHAIVLH